MATLRGRPGLAGRPKSSPVVKPFSPLTASPLATMSPLLASAKRGLARALEASAAEEPAILVTGPTCAEGTNARATQDVPKMAKPEIAEENFIVSVVLSGSDEGCPPCNAWLDATPRTVRRCFVPLLAVAALIWSQLLQVSTSVEGPGT